MMIRAGSISGVFKAGAEWPLSKPFLHWIPSMYGNVDEAPPYITIIDFKEDVVLCVVTAECQISLDATNILSGLRGESGGLGVETLESPCDRQRPDIASWLGLAATEHR